jgi:hypothetical protein
LFINLTPFIPLSFKGEGEEILERGEAPLFPMLPLPLLREGGQGDGLLNDLNIGVVVNKKAQSYQDCALTN